jgi:hypothetical protein
MSADPKTPTTPPAAGPQGPPPKSVDELIAEQGVKPLERFEDLYAVGRDWWTDAEFAAFLEHLRATRGEKN